MSSLNPMTWSLDFFLMRGNNDPGIKQMRKERIVLASVYLTTFALSAFWLAQVMKYVPEPYLDEVFHIPQAQAYCRGEFNVWDPKLTTPPGLYVVSAVLIKLIKGGSCTVLELRGINCLTLIFLLPAAHGCRICLMGRSPQKKGQEDNDFAGPSIDWDAVHTAVNLCLFPPIFFFSGLYYTDVLSTCIVVKAYEHFLRGQRGHHGSISSGLFTYLVGVMALLMRQTNVFWVAIFMGGLEIARAFEGIRFFAHGKEEIPSKGHFNDFIMASCRGAIHDPRLEDANALDFLWCAASLGAAAISHPRRVAGRVWPHIALLVSFAGFVLWNGGVVLGDKSNHVATIHLPQMLYIWSFMAFFSLPLLYSSTLLFLLPFLRPFKWWTAFLPSLPSSGRQLGMSTAGWLLAGIVIALGVVHFNTIIHPFTLADNRHYVFYVFRYTIRRQPRVKYALAPFYVLCALFVLRTMAGFYTLRHDVTVVRNKDETSVASIPGQSALPDRWSPSSRPTTSFTLIWLLSTALSLITAPLVEPRYFIIPWVIWRLQIPELPLPFNVKGPAKETNVHIEKRRNASRSCWAGWAKYWAYQGHDHRLWCESIWFLLISLVTGCIFLFKGFEWPQEPGKVQRFMW